MAKSIETLVEDIYSTFNGNPFSDDAIALFGQTLGRQLSSRITQERGTPTLRVSNLSSPCSRKLWYSINQHEDAEPVGGPARFKFLYGDLLEELVLFLAEQAGHRVEAAQEEVDINGVKGHIDCIIDGRLVDVKSASPFGFKKFESNGLVSDDPFGYLGQINAYYYALKDDPRITDKGIVSFLAIEKVLGKLCLDSYITNEVNYDELVTDRRSELALSGPPDRAYGDVEDGKSGNRKLSVACSYCPFKRTCWTGLRTFIYSNGPTFLTQVSREPKVPELDHKGEFIVKF